MTDGLERALSGVLVAAASLLAAATVASCGGAVVDRSPAPDVPALATLEGTAPLDLEAHHGRVVVLDFMSAWCEPCVDGLPAQIELWERYHRRGVEFVLVAQDAPDDPALARLVEQHGVPFTVARDPDQVWLDAFGFRAVPSLVVLDTEGRVALSVVDPETLEPGAVERLLDRLLAD